MLRIYATYRACVVKFYQSYLIHLQNDFEKKPFEILSILAFLHFQVKKNNLVQFILKHF